MPAGKWPKSEAAPAGGWGPALELGAMGLEPWGEVRGALRGEDPTPDIQILCRLAGRHECAPGL